MSDEIFDYRLKGKRIKLIHTQDPYTKLRSGDLGTIEYSFMNLDTRTISIKWDSGSNLSLLSGIDMFEILD